MGYLARHSHWHIDGQSPKWTPFPPDLQSEQLLKQSALTIKKPIASRRGGRDSSQVQTATKPVDANRKRYWLKPAWLSNFVGEWCYSSGLRGGYSIAEKDDKLLFSEGAKSGTLSLDGRWWCGDLCGIEGEKCGEIKLSTAAFGEGMTGIVSQYKAIEGEWGLPIFALKAVSAPLND